MLRPFQQAREAERLAIQREAERAEEVRRKELEKQDEERAIREAQIMAAAAEALDQEQALRCVAEGEERARREAEEMDAAVHAVAEAAAAREREEEEEGARLAAAAEALLLQQQSPSQHQPWAPAALQEQAPVAEMPPVHFEQPIYAPGAAMSASHQVAAFDQPQGIPLYMRPEQTPGTPQYEAVWGSALRSKIDSSGAFDPKTALGKGLANPKGDYNCFLNVIIQSLWQLEGFREALIQRVTVGYILMEGDEAETRYTLLKSLVSVFQSLSGKASTPKTTDQPASPVWGVSVR